ncbi:NAD(P)H-dependent oxidoreductase [Gammaproteobacteria bacterium]|nr:NAD(P)H-dependent oxidoreductase [Gammaproteobacteria bacterium]
MTISILAVSGSLRKESTNTRLLQEVEKLAGPGISFRLFDGVENLPHFNPDKETSLDEHTANWIQQVHEADALIVASPEYAHGIPGAFKNALDWLVGTDAFIGKPFCLYRACPRPEFAPEALLEVLRTMSGLHVIDSDVTIDLGRDYATSHKVLEKDESREKILDSIKYLYEFIIKQRIN